MKRKWLEPVLIDLEVKYTKNEGSGFYVSTYSSSGDGSSGGSNNDNSDS